MRPITARLQGRLDRKVKSDPTDLLRDALAEIERLREALCEIEKIRYIEGRSSTWKMSHMGGVSTEALADIHEDKPDIDLPAAWPGQGAAMGDGWQPIETAPKDGTEVLLFTRSGITQAWFARGEWSDDTPISPAEYNGDVWVCYDDAFQIEVELADRPERENHGEATHWMPRPQPPKQEGDT